MTARVARIIGDGPAGLVAALALAQRGWRVTVATAPRRRRTARIDVLGGSALPVLQRLGLSRDDLLRVASPCPGRWTRWGGEARTIDHLRTLESAWAVDRPAFDRLLAERAVGAGVRFAERGDGGQAEGEVWTVNATGHGEAVKGQGCDDRLVTLTCTGTLDPAGGEVDARLLVEACPEGWAYGVSRGGTRLCLGVVTDLEALRGSAAPRAFLARTLRGTERIARMLERLGADTEMRGCVLSCRQRPLFATARHVRVGDARMAFDPLAGRGLWEAIHGTERVVTLLDEAPERLGSEEGAAHATYAGYLRERRGFYAESRERFGPGFWARRLSADGAPSGHPSPTGDPVAA